MASRKSHSLKEVSKNVGAQLAVGAVAGAVTRHTITVHRPGYTAMQVGSAVAAAAASGAGVGGSVAAGTAVVTAKVAAVAAFGAAAAPVAAAVSVGYLLYRIFDDM